MKYHKIDHLLLNVNKGLDQTILSQSKRPAIPRPGDSITVSVSDGRLISILIHQFQPNTLVFMGKTMSPLHGEDDRNIIESGAHVSFSYNKIAGIQRR